MPPEADPISQDLAAQAAPPAASPPSAAPSPAPAAASPAGGGGAAPPSAAVVGVRDALKEYGLDLSSLSDDRAALAALANGYRQAQQLSPIAQQYMQHQTQFQAYLAQQQEAERQRQAQQAQSWWKAPEFDPGWRNQIVKDPVTGKLVPAEGASPDIVQKYMQAMQHTQGFFDKFAFDPIGTIRPGIEEVVREVAQQLMQQQMGGYQEQQFAKSWVQENSSWIHARNEQGQLIPDPQTGMPALSPLGQRFRDHVQTAERMGIQSAQGMQEYALRMVQNDYLMATRQQQPAQPGQPQQTPAQIQGDAAKNAFLQQAASRQPNYGAAAAATPPRPKNAMELEQQMLQEMAKNGFAPGTLLPIR